MDRASACPCGSGHTYGSCCARLHDGEPAPTAEALMRSRYSAFVVGDVDHLLRSWHPRTRPQELSLPRGVIWLGLEVGRVTGGGPEADVGTVELTATSRLGGRTHVQHEVSRFERRRGTWVYVDGDPSPCDRRAAMVGPSQPVRPSLRSGP